MASTQADPGTFPGGNTHSPNPGWRNRTLHFVATWWPALFTGAAATAVASFLYVASALAFIPSAPRLQYRVRCFRPVHQRHAASHRLGHHEVGQVTFDGAKSQHPDQSKGFLVPAPQGPRDHRA